MRLAPKTYTGPHVRPDPGTRPPPPSPSAYETTTTPAPRNKPRTTSGGRNRRVPPTYEPEVPTTRGRGRGGRGTRGGRGGRGTREGRGGATALFPLSIVAPVQVASSTTIAFGRGVGNSSTNSGGGALRGRGERSRARGKTAHRRNGRIVGIGILQDKGPTLTREPTPVQVNPIPGLDGSFLRGTYGGRGGGPVMRGGGAFSSTYGRGKRPRMMYWLGTKEQWANEGLP
ncbi:uncharacterized protein LOC113291625 [Papaver somniferum]|uniref:uncharacterized protein LOC113291625 n=1 Tax=Papaver somniferum TaxID=3469 RepID=UPI000E7034F0|nr:uncharacterized protein LOC113291625 [Papaver somniferum]